MPRSVHELTSAIASGDTEALSDLYRERFDWVYAESRRCTGRDESFCLDVVQDTMLKVIRSMKPIDNEPQLIAWLRTTVRRCAYDRLRAETRRRQREQAASTESSRSGHAQDDDRLQWLAAQLLQLDPSHGHLLTLRYRLGWTLQEIAESLRLKSGAVDGRLQRLLDTLRKNALEDFHD